MWYGRENLCSMVGKIYVVLNIYLIIYTLLIYTKINKYITIWTKVQLVT